MLRSFLIAAMGCLLATGTAAQDVFLKNVNGYTLQGDDLVRFDALLVRDGKVQAVGAAQILEPYAKDGTVRDMAGKTVLPGLSPAHTALTERAAALCKSDPSKTLEACVLVVLYNDARRGVTLVQDAATTQDVWFVLRSLEDRGLLPVRVYASIDANSPSYEPLLKAGAYAGTYKHMLALRSISWRRSHPVHSCAPDQIQNARSFPRTFGTLDPIALRNWIARGVMRGYQLRIGSTGKADVAQVLEAYGEVTSIAGTGGRHILEPLVLPKSGAIAQLKNANITLSFAPCLNPLLKDRPSSFAQQKAKRDVAFFDDAVAQAAPLAIAAGSPVNVMAALADGFDRRDGVSPRLKAAFKAYTSGAAYAAFWDQSLGSLDAGKWADFVVIDRSIFDAAPLDDPNSVQVLETWVAGKQVYKR